MFIQILRKAAPARRALFLLAAIGATLYGGSKTTGNRVARGGTRALPMQRAANLPRIGVWPDSRFTMPDGAMMFDPWNRHGAVKGWTRIGWDDESFVAMTGATLRRTPREIEGQLGLGLDSLVAVPGVSRLWWWTDENGTRMVAWERFRRSLMDATEFSAMIRIGGDSYDIHTNGTVSAEATLYDPSTDDTLEFLLTAPDCVCRCGARRPLSLEFTSEQEKEGTVTLRCNSGGDRVRLWTSATGGSVVTLPKTIDVAVNNTATFYVEYLSASEQVDDIEFTVTHSAANLTRTATTTAVSVDRIRISSPVARAPGYADFQPGENLTFDSTDWSCASNALTIPFGSVADAALSVTNFAIDVETTIRPSGYCPNLVWNPLIDTPDSGTMTTVSNGLARLVNPKLGGVYRYGVHIGGVPCRWTAVLPLASAGIDQVITNNLVQADAFVEKARTVHVTNDIPSEALQGYFWFGTNGNGYYRGRPESADAAHRTVWFHNQVNNTTGLGAVTTLAGYPIRLEKMSNLLCGYCCEKLNVALWKRTLANHLIGTTNDVTGRMSWRAGEDIAKGADAVAALAELASNMWVNADAKVRNLWPNPEPAFNYVNGEGEDFDCRFYAPGYLYLQPGNVSTNSVNNN